MCLRPGGPVECLPVVSVTGDGFHATLKARRADTVFGSGRPREQLCRPFRPLCFIALDTGG